MTDYQEEQRNELEALESIYPEEFTVVEEPSCFRIETFCEDPGEEHEDCKVSACLQFTYVETYPDAVPLIEIASCEGLEDELVEQLREFLLQQAEENLGMVMVFTLVSAAQEKLNEYVEELKRRKEEEKIRKQREEEEREKAVFTGTHVNYETFMKWRIAFEKEINSNKKNNSDSLKGKLTGRQLFERDASMNLSDISFFEGLGQEQDEEVEVEVDETLFQDLDDLELEDGD